MKRLLTISFIALAIAACSSYAPPDPCPGAQDCGDGTCAPIGNVCCGNGLSCPRSYVCGPYNTCVDSRVAACLSHGEEPCNNSDGVIDCAPPGATCCGNHRWCPFGRACLSDGVHCSN